MKKKTAKKRKARKSYGAKIVLELTPSQVKKIAGGVGVEPIPKPQPLPPRPQPLPPHKK